MFPWMHECWKIVKNPSKLNWHSMFVLHLLLRHLINNIFVAELTALELFQVLSKTSPQNQDHLKQTFMFYMFFIWIVAMFRYHIQICKTYVQLSNVLSCDCLLWSEIIMIFHNSFLCIYLFFFYYVRLWCRTYIKSKGKHTVVVL